MGNSRVVLRLTSKCNFSNEYSSSLLAVLEQLSGDDDKTLQTGVDNLQDCSTKKKTDECDTAAEVYGCNNEKNPTLTSAAINSFNSSSPATNDPTPVANKSQCITTHLRTCPLKINCTVNVTRRNEILAGTSSEGKLTTTAKGFKYFIKDIGPHNYEVADLYCCQIGMKLATFDTDEIFSDFYAVAPGGDSWTFIGPTYDNGDNTDSWCETYQPIPLNIILRTYEAYGRCWWTKMTKLYISGKTTFIAHDADFLVNWFACKL